MRILGIAGYSGSGKTALLTSVLPYLAARGIEVATLKHAHHGFDPLPPNHPSESWRAVGAHEVVLAAPGRHMLVHELRGAPEPASGVFMPLLSPVDLLLIEGYKFGLHDKIEVFRRDHGAPLLAASDPRVIALATDCGHPDDLPRELQLPIFAMDDVAAIARFIAALCSADAKGSGTRVAS